MLDRRVLGVDRLHHLLAEAQDLLTGRLERRPGDHAEADGEVVDTELLGVLLEALPALLGRADDDVLARRVGGDLLGRVELRVVGEDPLGAVEAHLRDVVRAELLRCLLEAVGHPPVAHQHDERDLAVGLGASAVGAGLLLPHRGQDREVVARPTLGVVTAPLDRGRQLAPAPEGKARLLIARRREHPATHVVEVAMPVEPLALRGERPIDQAHAVLEAAEHALLGHAELAPVTGVVPPSPRHVQPAAREVVDDRALLGDVHRVVQRVDEAIRPEPDPFGLVGEDLSRLRGVPKYDSVRP